MAVTATTSGRPPKPPKPKKPPKPPKPIVPPAPPREAEATARAKSTSPQKDPISSALKTVGTVVGQTVSKGRSKRAEKIVGKPKTAGGTMTAARESFSTPQSEMKHARMELASAKPKERAGTKLRAEVRAERQEQRNETRKAGGGKAKTYTAGPRKAGSETRTTSTGTRSKPKADIYRSANDDRPGKGGGFGDLGKYQTPASFDKLPDTRFTPLPGSGSEGGGGGGASVTGTSLSGLAGADLDTLLKGAKKGKRQKKRRGTE